MVHVRKIVSVVCVLGFVAAAMAALTAGTAGAVNSTNATFRTDFANAAVTQIDLTQNVTLANCVALANNAAIRTNGANLVVDGHGFTISQTCTDSGVLENVGTGAASNAGSLTLENVTITGGTKNGLSSSFAHGINGGGVYSDAALTLDHAIVTGNTVNRGSGAGGNGGGVAGGPMTVTDSTISANIAQNGGGGVEVSSLQPLVITRSTISGNTATAEDGGGFAAAAQGTAAITDSAISGNTAGTFAGGGFLGVGPNTITGSTFNGNHANGAGALGEGGGVSITGPTTIVNSTFSGNTATTNGGGIAISDAVKLAYVTIAGNTAAAGTEISADPSFGTWTAFGVVIGNGTGGSNCDKAATTSIGYDFEQSTNTCGFGAGPGDTNTGGDPLLAALAANGGLGLTRLPGTGSALRDKIPAAACTGPGAPIPTVTTDERGITRPQNGACDIGAVEAVLAIVAAPALTG